MLISIYLDINFLNDKIVLFLKMVITRMIGGISISKSKRRSYVNIVELVPYKHNCFSFDVLNKLPVEGW